MDNHSIPKNNKLLENARKLRREMTRHEKHLWYDFLQNYPIKIYKQRIIDNFIADFYCHQARLVIELDGSQHSTKEGQLRDAARNEILEKYGILIIRFSNQDIDKDFRRICDIIDQVIKDRIGEPP